MRLRVRAGMSRVQLSGLIGKSPSWLYKVERGDLIPDRLAVLAELARVLGVDLVELAGRPVPAPLMSATARRQPVAGPAAAARASAAPADAAAPTAAPREAPPAVPPPAAVAGDAPPVAEGRPATPPASPAPPVATEEQATPPGLADRRRVLPLPPRGGRLGRGAILITGGILTLAAAAAGVTVMTPVSAPQRLPATHGPARIQAEVPALAPTPPVATPDSTPAPARHAPSPEAAPFARQAVAPRRLALAPAAPPPPPAAPQPAPATTGPGWWGPWSSWWRGGCSAGAGCPASRPHTANGCSHAAVARDTGPVGDGQTWRLRVTVRSGAFCVRWDNPGMDGAIVGPDGSTRTARAGGWVLAAGGPGVYTLVLRRVDGWAPDHSFVEAID